MLSHPLDESRTKEMFKFLHSTGVEIELQAIRRWAVEKQWEKASVKEFTDLARKINSGKRVVINYPGPTVLVEVSKRQQGNNRKSTAGDNSRYFNVNIISRKLRNKK